MPNLLKLGKCQKARHTHHIVVHLATSEQIWMKYSICHLTLAEQAAFVATKMDATRHSAVTLSEIMLRNYCSQENINLDIRVQTTAEQY